MCMQLPMGMLSRCRGMVASGFLGVFLGVFPQHHSSNAGPARQRQPLVSRYTERRHPAQQPCTCTELIRELPIMLCGATADCCIVLFTSSCLPSRHGGSRHSSARLSQLRPPAGHLEGLQGGTRQPSAAAPRHHLERALRPCCCRPLGMLLHSRKSAGGRALAAFSRCASSISSSAPAVPSAQLGTRTRCTSSRGSR